MRILILFNLLLQCIYSFRLSNLWTDPSLVFTVLGDWGSPERDLDSSEAGQVPAATSMNIKSKYKKSKVRIIA